MVEEAGGNDAAIWLEAHYDLLVAVVLSTGIPRDDAFDLAQIASLRIWQRWDTWRDNGITRERWAIAVARNASLDWHRRRAVRIKFLALFLDSVGDVEEAALTRLWLAHVWKQLSVTQRQLAVEIAAGYTMREMGERRGKRVSAIKAANHRLREHARTIAA